MENNIKLDNCTKRNTYKINSRNLSYGVFDGVNGFTGIRSKAKMRYLFTEYHREIGPPFGTVSPIENLGTILPDDISLKESLGTVGNKSRRPMSFLNRGNPSKPAWYYDDIHCEERDPEDHPVSLKNEKLFEFLLRLEIIRGGIK